MIVSIHAPHAGCDRERTADGRRRDTFQSTRPMRGATAADEVRLCAGGVSIHAPHAGRDGFGAFL